MRTYRINIVYRGIGKNYNETVWGRSVYKTVHGKLTGKMMLKIEKELSKKLNLKNCVITNYKYY